MQSILVFLTKMLKSSGSGNFVYTIICFYCLSKASDMNISRFYVCINSKTIKQYNMFSNYMYFFVLTIAKQ